MASLYPHPHPRPRPQPGPPPPTRPPPLSSAGGGSGHPCSRAHCTTSRCPPLSCTRNRAVIPRAVVLPRPLQHRQVPLPSGGGTGRPRHGQSCSSAHFNSSRCPPSATPPGDRPSLRWSMFSGPNRNRSPAPAPSAKENVNPPLPHGQPCSCAHCNTRCPRGACARRPAPQATVLPRPHQHSPVARTSQPHAQVCSSHGHPCSRDHFRTSRCPAHAAASQTPYWYLTGSRAPAPTATPSGALSQRRTRRSPRSTGIRCPSPRPNSRRTRQSPRA